jgi:hypothetical protein
MMALRRNAIACCRVFRACGAIERAKQNRQRPRQHDDRSGGERSAMTNEVPQHAGLCAGCAHVRVVVTPRSRFVLCERSRASADFPRYPRLPVLACRGFEPRPADAPAPPDAADGAPGN